MNITEVKVAVLGGAGFLGSHIVQRLRDRGVSCDVPRTNDGWDLRSLADAERYFSEVAPDLVFNCAANQGGLAYQQLYPATIYYDNQLMGLNSMEAARRAGVKKYVNVIAGCSYPGTYHGDVMSEENYWDGPLHESVVNYGITKKVQTVQAQLYRKQFGFNAISLILANLYGPGEHFEPDRSHALAALLRKFHEAKLHNQPSVEVWGTGRAIREWLYVSDAADGLIRAAEVYDQPEPVNLGTGEGHTISELADLIKDIVGYIGNVEYDTSKPDGAPRKVMDTKKMQAVLEWQPTTEIEAGVRTLYTWYCEHQASALERV